MKKISILRPKPIKSTCNFFHSTSIDDNCDISEESFPPLIMSKAKSQEFQINDHEFGFSLEKLGNIPSDNDFRNIEETLKVEQELFNSKKSKNASNDVKKEKSKNGKNIYELFRPSNPMIHDELWDNISCSTDSNFMIEGSNNFSSFDISKDVEELYPLPVNKLF